MSAGANVFKFKLIACDKEEVKGELWNLLFGAKDDSGSFSQKKEDHKATTLPL